MSVDKWVHAFPNGICSKVKVIVRMEFELAHCDVAVQHVSPRTTGTSLKLVTYVKYHGSVQCILKMQPNADAFEKLLSL